MPIPIILSAISLRTVYLSNADAAASLKYLMASAPIIYKGISITWSRTLPPHPCGLALAIRRQVNVSAPAHVTARPRAVAQRACARPRGKAATSDTYVTSQSHAFIEDAPLCLCMDYLFFMIALLYPFFIIVVGTTAEGLKIYTAKASVRCMVGSIKV